GYAEGGVTGLGARDMDFVIPDDETVNTAVVLPLARSISGEVMAGVVTRYLPVPQRYESSGLTLTVPSFPLPRTVRTLWEARKYIAEQFEVKPENVVRMGESYFCHAGLTPHRVYPFAVSVTAKPSSGPGSLTRFSPLRGLWKMLYRIVKTHQSYMKVISEAYQALGVNSDMSLGKEFGLKLSDRKAAPVSVTNADVIADEDNIRALPDPEPPPRASSGASGASAATRAAFHREGGVMQAARAGESSDPGVPEEEERLFLRDASRPGREDRDSLSLQALRNE
ncbi:MAG TPA: class I SAM-dependent methyltransferase, partial [Alphaproteobacteria bacterium]|nr:class I SAM-dependent methyltransferase [Alphaproteobacteria bacterium]